MIARWAGVAFWCGLALAILPPALAGILSAAFGQAPTLWFLAEVAALVGVVMAAFGFLLRRYRRPPLLEPWRAPEAALAVPLAFGAFLVGCSTGSSPNHRADADPGHAVSGPTTYYVGHDVKFVNVRVESESDVETIVGTAHEARGAVVFDREKGTGSVRLSFLASAFDTGSNPRNEQLRAALDVKKFPDIVFKSRSVKQADAAGRFEVSGDLNLHGVTKEIALVALVREIPESAIESTGFPDGRWLKLSAELTARFSDFGVSSAVPDTWKVKVVIFAGTATPE